MAELKRDNNFITVDGGITDDAAQTVQPLRVDPATYRLLTDASVSGATITGGTVSIINSAYAGGSISVNIVDGDVSSGSPVNIQWVGGTTRACASGSLAVNIVSGNVSTGTTNIIESGTVRVSDGSVQLMGTSNVTILGMSTLIISDGTLTSGTIRIAGGSVSILSGTVNVGTGSIQLLNNSTISAITNRVSVNSVIVSDATITSGTVRIAGGSISILGTGSVALNYPYQSGGSLAVNMVAGAVTLGTLQIADGTLSRVNILNSGTITSGTVNINTGTVNVGTVSEVVKLTSGTVNLNTGTINVSTVSTVSRVNILNDGTITSGTVRVAAGSIQLMGNSVVTGGSIWVAGQTTADAALNALPVTIGGRTSLAAPSAMSADGDAVNAWFSRTGALYVIPTSDGSTKITSGSVQLMGTSNVMVVSNPTQIISDGTITSGTVRVAGGSISILGTGSVALNYPYQSGGSVAVNMVASSISISTGSAMNLQWVGGSTSVCSGGSISVNMVSGSISVTTGTVSVGTISIGSVSLINASDGTPVLVDSWGNLMVSLGTKLDSTNDSITVTSGTVNINTGTINVATTSTVSRVNILNDGTISSGTFKLAAGGTITAIAGAGLDQIETKLNTSNGHLSTIAASIDANKQMVTISDGDGTVKISGGSVQLMGTSYVDIRSTGANATATVNIQTLSGGTVNIAGGSINISDGTIKISGGSISVTSGSITVTSGTIWAVGNRAHDSVDTSYPIKIGTRAITSLSGLTLVAADDRTDLFSGVDGVLLTRPYCNLEDIISGASVYTAAGTSNLIASAGAGIRNYITTLTVYNTSANNVSVKLLDSATTSTGTVLGIFPAPTVSGAVINLLVPLRGSFNTAVCVDVSTASSSVFVTAVGFKSKI